MPVLANKSITRPGGYWNQSTQKWLTELVPVGQCVRISPRYKRRWLKKSIVSSVHFDLPYHWCCGGITIGVEGGSEMAINGFLYTDGGVISWAKRGGILYRGTSITIPKAASYWSNRQYVYRVRAARVSFWSSWGLTNLNPEDIEITGAFASGAGDLATGEKRVDFTT